MPPVNYRRQQAAALITALFITAIAAILATAIATRQRLLIAHTQMLFTADQAYLDLRGVQEWGLANVLQYQQAVAAPKTDVTPKLITQFGPKKFEGAVLSGVIKDQQAQYNINNLSQSNQQPAFAALLMAVDRNLSARAAMTLTQNVANWISTQGSNDYYLQQKPPYLAAHQLFVQKSGLRAVEGFTAEIYNAIAPYITALPLSTNQIVPINVNTVSAPVLMTLAPGNISLQQAQSVVACVKQKGPFTKLANFYAACLQPAKINSLPNTTTSSNYFLIRGQASIGQSQVVLHSLIYAGMTKPNNPNTINTEIIWQALN